MIFQFSKFSLKLSTYRWDTLYMNGPLGVCSLWYSHIQKETKWLDFQLSIFSAKLPFKIREVKTFYCDFRKKKLCSHCSFAHLAPGSSCCIWYETKTSPTSCSRWWWNEIFFELPHITLLVHQDFHFPFLIMFFKDFWQYFFNDIVDSLVLLNK